MAERFVLGFSIDPAELTATAGSGRAAAEIIEAAGGGEEVDELLEEWAPDDPLTAEEAVAEITAGALDPEHAYEYRRALELIATAVGTRFDDEIEVVLTYYLPNESHGRWNPVLEALGLSALASAWGTSNTAFPWSEGTSRVDWPIATLIEQDGVSDLAAELDNMADRRGHRRAARRDPRRGD